MEMIFSFFKKILSTFFKAGEVKKAFEKLLSVEKKTRMVRLKLCG